MIDKKKLFSKGQALVEFALVLLLFLIFVMVIFDLSRAIYYYSALNNAVREGARFASIEQYPTISEIEDRVQSLAVGLDVYVDPTPQLTNTMVTVWGEFEYEPATPILFFLSGDGSITLKSKVTMQREPISR